MIFMPIASFKKYPSLESRSTSAIKISFLEIIS